MKKIFVMLYARANLGDDLFLKILLERYPNIQFYINIAKEFSNIVKNYKNVTIVEKQPERFENRIPEEYDGYIYIGGSIFIEGGTVYNIDSYAEEFMEKCKEKNIPFFYISSNFGPHKTEEYMSLARRIYSNCNEICFRDKYSYELFKDIETVSYAPDAIFTYNIQEIKKQKNTIGISVIDLSSREDLKHLEEQYYKALSSNICSYIDKGYNINLFSFCKYEGDEKAIKKLKKRIPTEYLNKIEVIKYNGNIQKFIDKYKSMEYMICSRFHAMILSVICKQKMFVMSYSKKIDNVIKDLEFSVKTMNFNQLQENTSINLRQFKKTQNIENIKEAAQEQFKKIDEYFA